MCGRFTLTNESVVKTKIGATIQASFNITPSRTILILEPTPKMVIWGLSPVWAKKPMNLINARIETLNQKPAFKETKPCLVVTDGWYEWKKSNNSEKYPFYFHKGGKIIYMAGIYNEIGCSIVTKNASPDIANIHHRQPVLLNKLGRRHWIKGLGLRSEHFYSDIESYRVGNFVNSPKFDEPACIAPLRETPI